MDLHLSTSTLADRAVVRVSGEIDLDTASQLNDHALQAMREHGPHLVLDLGRVTFMDSTGLKVLLAVHRRAELSGGSLGLVGVTRPVMKVLTVTGLTSTFAFFDDVDSAVAGGRSPSPAD